MPGNRKNTYDSLEILATAASEASAADQRNVAFIQSRSLAFEENHLRKRDVWSTSRAIPASVHTASAAGNTITHCLASLTIQYYPLFSISHNAILPIV